MQTKENILVTGATGFIGRHLCRALIRDNYEVYGLARTLLKEYLEDFSESSISNLLIVDLLSNEGIMKAKIT